MNKKELLDSINSYKTTYQELLKITSPDKLNTFYTKLKYNYIYTSNTVEGATLSLEDTTSLLQSLTDSDTEDSILLHGHSRAFDRMISLANCAELNITEELLKELHSLFYPTTKKEDVIRYRTEPTVIPGTNHLAANPEDIPRLMSHYIGQMNMSKVMFDPIEFAIFSHKRIIDIQPYDQGNGQLARLVLNLLLLHAGYSLVSISPEIKEDYLSAILRSQADIYPDIDPILALGTLSIYQSQKYNCELLSSI